MTKEDYTQPIKAKYNALDTVTRKRVDTEASSIKRFGSNCFFINTGCYADNPGSHWLVVEWALESLRL